MKDLETLEINIIKLKEVVEKAVIKRLNDIPNFNQNIIIEDTGFIYSTQNDIVPDGSFKLFYIGTLSGYNNTNHLDKMIDIRTNFYIRNFRNNEIGNLSELQKLVNVKFN